MNTLNSLNQVNNIIIEKSTFEFDSHYDEFYSKFNEKSYRLGPDYDDLIVGITTTGSIIYDFEEMYCRYMELNEYIIENFKDLIEFIDYAKTEVFKMVRILPKIDGEEKILPMLINVNKTNYEMKYD